MKLSIVIPCYNEAGNIPLIVQRLQAIVGDRRDVEVLLVDNGSTDDSAQVFLREVPRESCISVVTMPRNLGYGHGILEGLRQASGDVLGWTHADMQTDPLDVLTAFDLYQERQTEKVMIKGRRQNRRLLEAFFTFGMQVIASAALGVWLSDVNAQPKLFSREFYSRFIASDSPTDFSLDLYLLYQARVNGYQVVEVPVVFAKRVHGEAKGGGSWRTRIKLIRRTLAYVFELRRTIRMRGGVA